MNNIKRMRNERGFTLIELLVVIVILGILAAVVVFAVGGLSDKGEKSSCKIDTRTLRTAEEAYFAKTGSYGTQDQLVTSPDNFLSEKSVIHDVTLTQGTDDDNNAATPAVAPFKGYTVHVTDDQCYDASKGAGGVDASAPYDAESTVDAAHPGNS